MKDVEDIHRPMLNSLQSTSAKMKKIVLSVNAGSSSVKISAYSALFGQAPIQLAEAQISGLTAPPPTLRYTRRGEKVIKDEEVKDQKVSTQADAFDILLKTLIDDNGVPEISSKEDIAYICHRIVHGGDFVRPKLISDETYHNLEKLTDMAPLHNSTSLAIVHRCMSDLPKTTLNIACFDSQFHHTIPEHIRTYPINQDIARSNHLRKYGFHGISYAFIARATAEFLGKKVEDVNIIALHLGSGASACAIKGGKSLDTSMGLTPLAGLPGATRSGSVDPSLVFHYASDVGKLSPASTKELHISRAEEILNKESGWKALTGTTNFGTITAALDSSSSSSSNLSQEDLAKMRLAFNLFVDRICGFIGSYYVSLQGQVDALVFAGGIGEKSDRLRATVVEQVGCLGFGPVDKEANETRVKEELDDDHAVIEIAPGSKRGGHRVLVCKTDEQFEMARACAEDGEFWR
ncbi:Acetokinase family-domain-containing protein [Neurospora tetraspora]|uniref:Probable acetate kinase n=1 Tax=Neurospora tetraspora TaxID=94610 RepID=A0AAE0JMN8_9PEZI|nr:Acetokinase family-domain-containing protein [Neurospora tetraspora]